MEKRCAACGEIKALIEFPVHSKRRDGRQSRCRPCKRQYDREYRQRRSPEALRIHRAQATENNRRLREHHNELIKERLDVVCPDCGIKWPIACMDFDHVRGKKLAHISLLRGNCSDAKLIAEMDKCDAVCSNCHRIRTALRGRFHSAAELQAAALG